MTTVPLGAPVSYCTQCGSSVEVRIPGGDNRPRYVCAGCQYVLYENPKIVVGCVPELDGQILLCKRAIEPRSGYWTVPAGFMELGETVEQAAIRETQEEACADVELGSLLAIVNLLRAGQVHIFFRASLPEPRFAAGEESLETRLVAIADIPWDDIAFPSITIALREYLRQRESGENFVYSETVGQSPR
jgi:ADP-ribose pyrophosphatase YjhB (NUDIX family)